VPRTARRAEAPAPRPSAVARRPPAGSEEARLLRVARELTALAAAGAGAGDAVRAAMACLAAPSPAGPAGRGRLLALAWAREQARLAMRDVLERGVAAGAVRADLAPDDLAWLALAGCEAAVREPAEAALDRVQALAAFLAAPADGAAPRAPVDVAAHN